MEDYHTHYLGQVSDGRLFMGYETSSIDYGEGTRKDYAVLHTFDKKGNYLSSEYAFAGSPSNGCGISMSDKMESMVQSLGKIKYKDITVKVFQTEIDGVLFGFVPDEESEMLHLQPGSLISFSEPWDGEYFT